MRPNHFHFLSIFISLWIATGAAVASFLLVYQGRNDGKLGFSLLCFFATIFTFTIRFFLKRRKRGPWLIAAITAVVGTYLTIFLIIFFSQTYLLFAPVAGKFDACPALTDNGFTLLHRNFENQNLRAFVRKVPDAQATLLIFHGNAESACKDDKYTVQIRDLERDHIAMNLVFAEYPGYKNDSGELSEANYLANASALRQWVAQEFGASTPVVVMGRSLGTSLATYTASIEPTAALILVSPFTSIEELAPQVFPLFPSSLMRVDPIKAYEWAEKVQAPTLILHGTADRLIPIAMGEAESRHFHNLVKFERAEGYTHNGIASAQSPIWKEINSFIKSILERN